MPTEKRRINLTLDDEMVEILQHHREEMSRGRYASISSAAVDLIRKGADAYYREHPGLTIAANADNLPEEERAAATRSAAERAAAKYWSDDDERGKDH